MFFLERHGRPKRKKDPAHSPSWSLNPIPVFSGLFFKSGGEESSSTNYSIRTGPLVVDTIRNNARARMIRKKIRRKGAITARIARPVEIS
jgi:hypothetical protein